METPFLSTPSVARAPFPLASPLALLIPLSTCRPCQFKHVMQPFDVVISPGGIDVHRRTSPFSGPTSTPTSSPTSTLTPSLTLTSTSTAFVATVALSISNRYDHTDRLQEHLVFGWKVEVDGLVIAEGDDLLPASEDALEENNRGKQRGWHPVAAAAAASPAAHGVSESTSAAGARKASGGGGSDDSDSKGSVAKVVFGAPSLLLPGQECWLTVTGQLREVTAWAAAGHVVGHTQLELNSEKVRASSVPADVLGRL